MVGGGPTSSPFFNAYILTVPAVVARGNEQQMRMSNGVKWITSAASRRDPIRLFTPWALMIMMRRKIEELCDDYLDHSLNC